jgi:glycosyltransferase involved in cell wall biosynthesis
MGRKRILCLSRGGLVNGSQRQLYYVVSNLNRDIYEPIVVCRKDGQFVSQLRDYGIAAYVLPLHPWRKFPAGLYRYFDAERLARFATQHKVALVHSSDLWLSGYLNWVAEKLKIPSILHVRTPICPADVHKHHCARATRLIAISRRIRKNLLGAGISPGKISLVEDAVDLELFRPRQRKANVLRQGFSFTGKQFGPELTAEGVLVGMVGRIDPSKRQLEFLQAAERIVQSSNRSVTFFMVGEVHSRGYFKQLKRFINKRGLEQYVFFTGRRDDVMQVLSSLDILVSLSGGSVMFEAMACGKPAVSAGFSTKEDSVHIQDGRTGLLVSSTRDSELVQCLFRLIDAPGLRRQIGREARRWAENNFSHTDMAVKTQQLYGQLLGC